MHCITSQLNLSQVDSLRQQFKHYDRSDDGRLDLLELRQVLEDAGVADGNDLEIVIESLDKDRSGLVEYSEFLAGCVSLASNAVKQQLQTAFAIFDLDGSGSITLDELKHVLTDGPNSEVSPTRPPSAAPGQKPIVQVLPDGKTVEEVMQDLDTNKTGRVEFAEFERYLLAEHDKTLSNGLR